MESVLRKVKNSKAAEMPPAQSPRLAGVEIPQRDWPEKLGETCFPPVGFHARP